MACQNCAGRCFREFAYVQSFWPQNSKHPKISQNTIRSGGREVERGKREETERMTKGREGEEREGKRGAGDKIIRNMSFKGSRGRP